MNPSYLEAIAADWQQSICAGDPVNGNKENARVVKTYVCKCGEVNRFSFETDFNFSEIRIDANCQGCGKDISISVENHVAGNGINGTSNTNGNYYPQSPAYGYNGYSSPAPSSSILEPSSATQTPQDSSSASAFPDFNFDALTSAVSPQTDSSGSPAQQAQAPDYSGTAEILGSLSSDIAAEDPAVQEVAEPAPPLAAKVFTTPVKKTVTDEDKEEKDLLSKEDEYYGDEAEPDEQEAFIDLFGRL